MAEKTNLSFESMMKMSDGPSGSYFTLKNNEEALIRILYNTYEDVRGYYVHEFPSNKEAGIVGATILCNKSDENPNAPCKWCDMNNTHVGRVVIPFYNIDKKEIQYFKRTVSWFKKSMKPYTDEVIAQGFPIAGQVYKIKRTGSGMDTSYPLIAVGSPDGKRAEDFGTVKDALSTGILKPYEFDYNPAANNNQQTRRTTDTFRNVSTADTF